MKRCRMFFITILMFICFYGSAGSIQTFPGDRRGRGQGSSVSFSKEDQKKSHAALISLPSLLLLFCSLSFFPAFPIPRATPASPPPLGCVHCCVCAPDGLIVALFGFVSPRACLLHCVLHISREAVSIRVGILEVWVPGVDTSRYREKSEVSSRTKNSARTGVPL